MEEMDWDARIRHDMVWYAVRDSATLYGRMYNKRSIIYAKHDYNTLQIITNVMIIKIFCFLFIKFIKQLKTN